MSVDLSRLTRPDFEAMLILHMTLDDRRVESLDTLSDALRAGDGFDLAGFLDDGRSLSDDLSADFDRRFGALIADANAGRHVPAVEPRKFGFGDFDANVSDLTDDQIVDILTVLDRSDMVRRAATAELFRRLSDGADIAHSRDAWEAALSEVTTGQGDAIKSIVAGRPSGSKLN